MFLRPPIKALCIAFPVRNVLKSLPLAGTKEVFALQDFEFPNLQVSKFTNLQAMQFRQANWLAQ